MDSTYIPVIVGTSISPNPARVGETILVSVSVIDVELVPRVLEITAGQIAAGVIA